MENNLIAWGVFGSVILVMLLLDLGVFNRKEQDVTMKNALTWSAVWILMAFAFCAAIYMQWIDAGGELHAPGAHVAAEHHADGEEPAAEPADEEQPLRELNPEERTKLARQNAIEFLTGYLIEESLSVDNLFVFVLIFQYFRVPNSYQRSVLYWGILGAIVMRAIFIALGVELVERFDVMIAIFGAFLVYTGIKLAFKGDDEVHPERNIVLRLFRRFVRVTTEYHGRSFFTRKDGVLYATPLLVVLVVVETTDLIFAVDSIPAILGVTTNPFIVYTSNIFAIMGLRSLYFALAGLLESFHYLKYGLSAILAFVGIKMLGEYFKLFHTPILVALSVVLGLLVVCALASVLFPPKKHEDEHPTEGQNPEKP